MERLTYGQVLGMLCERDCADIHYEEERGYTFAQERNTEVEDEWYGEEEAEANFEACSEEEASYADCEVYDDPRYDFCAEETYLYDEVGYNPYIGGYDEDL